MCKTSRKSMIIYEDLVEAVRMLAPETATSVLLAIFDYGLKGIEPADKQSVETAFVNMFRKRIDEDRHTYEAVCKRNRENGKKGGRSRKTKNPEKPTGTQSPLDNDNDNESTNVDNKESILSNTKEKSDSLPVKKDIRERQKEFWNELIPYISEGKYEYKMVEQFYGYWSEEETDKKDPKMRKEKEKTWNTAKRLARWKYNEDLKNGSHGR